MSAGEKVVNPAVTVGWGPRWTTVLSVHSRPLHAGVATAVLVTFLAIATPAAGDSQSPPGAAQTRCPGTHWVASWASAPSDALTLGDANLTPALVLGRQSFRMIVTPHRAGNRIRIHLTNRFGRAKVTFDHVTLANRAEGARLVPGSVRQVRFDGKRSVSVPAGHDVVSDPVRLRIRAFRPVAISYYIGGSALLPTEHFNANQTSYYTLPGGGDRADQVGAAGYGQKIRSWYYLSGLDVRAPRRAGAVVAFGDSITDGYVTNSPALVPASTIQNDADVRYPDFLQRRLVRARLPLVTVNEGISGNRVLADGAIPQFGPAAVDRIGADGAAIAGATNAIILEGINDLGIPPWPSAEDLVAGYRRLIKVLHRKGIHVLLGTIMPSGKSLLDGPLIAPTLEATRVRINAWIRSQHVSDGIVDFDRAMRDPKNHKDLNPAYADGDNLHPNPAGYRAMARAVPLTALRTRCSNRG